MNVKVLAALVVAVVSGCTKMEDFYPNATKTVVDGEEFMVRKINESTYQAMPNDPNKYSILTHEAGVWPRNIRAIEQVTGCQVAVGSVKNEHQNTLAAVAC